VQEQDDSQPPPHEEKVDKVEGGAEVMPNWELVSEGRVKGFEAHQTTKMTKARWDGRRLVRDLGFQPTC